MKIIKKLLFISYLLFMFIHLSGQPTTHISIAMDYETELIRFYLDKKEYHLAIAKIDEILSDNTSSDSLYYFKALALEGLKRWEEASDNYSLILQGSINQDLLAISLDRFEYTLSYLNAFISIEKISHTLNSVRNKKVRLTLLKLIASIYEQNQLFEEANDVYQTIIEEKLPGVDIIDLKLDIVANLLFLNNFKLAIEILDPIIAKNDSIYNEKALFFAFLANYSLNNYKASKRSLLKLYLEYPNHLNRKEIISGLADIYYLEKQYLMSWYLLNELYAISNDAQRFKVYENIENIKRAIAQDTIRTDQFKYFRPEFEKP